MASEKNRVSVPAIRLRSKLSKVGGVVSRKRLRACRVIAGKFGRFIASLTNSLWNTAKQLDREAQRAPLLMLSVSFEWRMKFKILTSDGDGEMISTVLPSCTPTLPGSVGLRVLTNEILLEMKVGTLMSPSNSIVMMPESRSKSKARTVVPCSSWITSLAPMGSCELLRKFPLRSTANCSERNRYVLSVDVAIVGEFAIFIESVESRAMIATLEIVPGGNVVVDPLMRLYMAVAKEARSCNLTFPDTPRTLTASEKERLKVLVLRLSVKHTSRGLSVSVLLL